MDEQLIKLGQISKLHGYKGDLIFRLANFNNSIVIDFNWVFVNLFEENVPWHVEEFRQMDSSSFIVKLTEINDEEAAKQFVGRTFLLPIHCLNLPELAELPTDNLVGWIIRAGKLDIGKVVEVIENKSQILILVQTPKGNVYIPFVEEFIAKVVPADNLIMMQLPDGLLDL